MRISDWSSDVCSSDLQIHAAQSVTEFHEIVGRTGLTSIQWMDAIGILSDNTIIGHGIFLDHHPWLHWTTRKDMGLLADRGATVAHCPTVFVRRALGRASCRERVCQYG